MTRVQLSSVGQNLCVWNGATKETTTQNDLPFPGAHQTGLASVQNLSGESLRDSSWNTGMLYRLPMGQAMSSMGLGPRKRPQEWCACSTPICQNNSVYILSRLFAKSRRNLFSLVDPDSLCRIQWVSQMFLAWERSNLLWKSLKFKEARLKCWAVDPLKARIQMWLLTLITVRCIPCTPCTPWLAFLWTRINKEVSEALLLQILQGTAKPGRSWLWLRLQKEKNGPDPQIWKKYIRMYMNIICRSYTNIRPQIAWKTLENTISALVVARYYFVVSAMLNPHDRNVLFQLHRCHSPNTTISYNR